MSSRSHCPISFSLELFGDRWTLLVVRDLAIAGKHTFSELRASGEGIASNILSDRLTRLETRGIVVKRPDPRDGRRATYHLTEAGKGLLPVLVEMVVWGAANDPDTSTPPGFLEAASQDRDGLIEQLRSKIDS